MDFFLLLFPMLRAVRSSSNKRKNNTKAANNKRNMTAAANTQVEANNNKQLAVDKGLSKDGVEAAKHLMSAIMYGPDSRSGLAHDVELTFRDPSKGYVKAYTQFAVLFSGGLLKVHAYGSVKASFTTRNPAEAMNFMATQARGFLVNVSLSKSLLESRPDCNSLADRLTTVWDLAMARRYTTPREQKK